MLFKEDILKRIKKGEINCAFRRWVKPTVKAGGTLRTPLGILAIESVEVILLQNISEFQARRAGFENLDVLRTELKSRPKGKFYKVEFRFTGADPRIELRSRTRFSQEDKKCLLKRLMAMDRRSQTGPWVKQVLRVIQKMPAQRAALLAEKMGLDTPKFKVRVRRLKELGLTESLGTGYRLSIRGTKALEFL